MGLPPKPRGAAWPRGSWAYDHCVAGARGRRGAARAPISQSNLRGGGAREMSKMERGVARAGARTVPRTPRCSNRSRRTRGRVRTQIRCVWCRAPRRRRRSRCCGAFPAPLPLGARLGKVAAYLKIPYPSSFSAATITSSPPAAPSTTGLAKRSSFRFWASSRLFFLCS